MSDFESYKNVLVCILFKAEVRLYYIVGATTALLIFSMTSLFLLKKTEIDKALHQQYCAV